MAADLSRFLKAQERDYAQALREIQSGRKRSHWMWYIFPQIQGLGFSSTAQFYAIENLQEAKDYLAHPVLGARLKEISSALLQLDGLTASEIFGYPDDLKLRSSMTLFALAEHLEEGMRPALIVAVPVGFVNVVESKERIFELCTRLGVPCIAAMGRKGGSSIAAAVCNALIYTAADLLDPAARGWN